MILWCFVFFLKINYSCGAGLDEVFKWKQIEFDISSTSQNGSPLESSDFVFPDTSFINNISLDYIPYNNVPMGVNHYNGRLFITMPRRRPGIPSTLNYIDILGSKSTKSPKLKPYPNISRNKLNCPLQADPNKLISVYRTRVDACGRLWFIDTGMLEYGSNRTQVQRPSIWILNLQTDEMIHRFEIEESVVPVGRGLASITVDVDSNKCDDAYAYIPDLVHNRLYVYSFQQNHMWRFQHNYFNSDPLWGDFNISGQVFQWSDGIFSITLGNKNKDGFRTAFFHPMASISEFAVSTKILRNESNSQRSFHGNDFQHLGVRGIDKQSTMHDFDHQTGIILYAEIALYGIGCWNTKQKFSSHNHDVIQQNSITMIYPSDLTIDSESTVWVITNSMPIFIYSTLDRNQYNFRVWKQSIRKAVEHTTCNN